MNYYSYGMPTNMQQTQMVQLVDPFVVQALKGLINKKLIVETIRGSISGKLADVKPDHIVVKEISGESVFFIRIQEIVFIMPD